MLIITNMYELPLCCTFVSKLQEIRQEPAQMNTNMQRLQQDLLRIEQLCVDPAIQGYE